MQNHLISKRDLRWFLLFYGTVLVLFLWGAHYINQPAISTASTDRLLPIYSVETADQAPNIALTINCAWGNEDIPQILDTLKTAKVTATFFLVGDFVDHYPDSVLAIHRAGHSIQNHSDRHTDYTTLSLAEIQADIKACNDKITAITGTCPTMVRCPSGSYNNQAIQAIQSLGLQAIQWSVDSLDWKGTTLEEMQARILPNLRYGDILLFHNDTAHTAESLATLITAMQEQGYQFQSLDDLLLVGKTTLDFSGRQSLCEKTPGLS